MLTHKKTLKVERESFNKNEGKNQAQQLCWKNYYLNKYKYNPELLSQKYLEKISEIEDIKLDYQLMNTWYIVINPNPKLMEDENELKEFIQKCKDSRYKKWIHTCKLWFEWRKDDMSTIHANFAITKSKYAPSRVKQEFYNSFKKWIGNKEHINVQRVRDHQFNSICEYQYADKKLKLDPIMRDILKMRDSYWTVNGIEDLNKL